MRKEEERDREGGERRGREREKQKAKKRKERRGRKKMYWEHCFIVLGFCSLAFTLKNCFFFSHCSIENMNAAAETRIDWRAELADDTFVLQRMSAADIDEMVCVCVCVCV